MDCGKPVFSKTDTERWRSPAAGSHSKAEQLSWLSRTILSYAVINSSWDCQGAWCFTMALRIVNSLRIQAIKAAGQ
jgi:hypothetical protein